MMKIVGIAIAAVVVFLAAVLVPLAMTGKLNANTVKKLAGVEEKKARDSLFKAFGARSTTTAKRRVGVIEPRPSPRWPQAELIGRAVADSLRSMLGKRAYVVVNPDSVRTMRPQFNTINELGNALSSDLLISIRINERSSRVRGAGFRG